MNKIILIFGVLFLAIACTVIGSDYQVPTEKNEISERAEFENVGEEQEYRFVAKNDFNPPNEELQEYVTSQVEMDGAHIRITADKIGEEYISGKAESSTAFRYGTFSFKINTIKGVGLFPAIWMLPSNGKTAYPEVDIYESIGNKPEEIYGVLHFRRNEQTARDFFTHEFPDDEIPETYQIKFEWTPNQMVWYLDNKVMYTIRNNVPQIPMYMTLNLAVGGRWPGSPDANTKFPAVFDIEVLEFEPEEIYSR